MSTTYDQIQAGWSAHGRDGEKIGEIEEIGQNYLLVTKGLIFPKDLYIPMSVVQNVDSSEGQVILDVEKGQVDDMGWDQPPEATGAGSWDEGSTSGMATQTTDAGTTDYSTTDAAYASNDASYGTTEQTTSATDDTQAEGDTLRVPVHEEQLRAERTADQAGEVRVDRNVVEEERTIDVPVTREEVEVRRVPVSGSASADASAFQSGDTIRVPVTEEQVHVTKEPRVVEEIEISKRQVTENQRVSDTVRREEVNVDDSGVRSGTGTGDTTDASYATGTTGTTGMTGTSGTTDATHDTTTSDDDRSRGRGGEVGGEAIGGGAGALGGAVVGGVVGGPIGAAVGGVIGGAGGAVAGESAEGGDEQGGSGVGGAAGALGGAVVGGAVAGPPGAVVGGAVGAGAGSGAGDKATEDDDDTSRR